MPRVNGAYVCPDWKDDQAPALDAAELLAIGQSIVANQDKLIEHDGKFTDIEALIAELQAAAGGGAKIATGSYTGTGTYGASNPCSLTFDFVPLVVILSQNGGNDVSGYVVPASGLYHLIVNGTTSIGFVTTSSSGKVVSFYHNQYADYQFNGSNAKTTYVAIG